MNDFHFLELFTDKLEDAENRNSEKNNRMSVSQIVNKIGVLRNFEKHTGNSFARASFS